ncbi:MAG: hypothetical protein FLDDKLPJ_01272 [Phycisphaerae bacterium]|nr:hypothetical protein [Phycisphaerae bacterium]
MLADEVMPPPHPNTPARETGPGAPARSASHRAEIAAIWFLAAAVFVTTRAAIVEIPLERDEGEYAYIAQRLLAGETPYLDQFNQKPPGVFVFYAAGMALGGPTVAALHVLLAIITGLTVVMTGMCLARLGHARAAPWAALALAVMSASPRVLGPSANTEHFANVCLSALAVACVQFRIRGGRPALIVAGAAGAAACLCKQVALLPACAILVLMLGTGVRAGADAGRSRPGESASESRSGVTRLSALGWTALGAAAVVAPVIVFFVSRGAWSAFVDAVLLHNLDYVRRNTWSEAAWALGRAAGRQWPCLAPAGILAAPAMLPGRRDESGATRIAATWLAAAGAAAAISFNFYDHYSIFLLPPLSMLAGLGVVRVASAARNQTVLRVGAALGGVIALAVGPAYADRSFWRASSAEERARILYGQNLVVEGRRIGEHLRRESAAEDRVLILGSEPQILYYAGLRSATRYTIMYPLFGPYADAASRQGEVIASIESAPPDWVLDVQVWSSRTPHAGRPLDLERKVGALILDERRYRLVGVAIPREREQRYDLRFGEDLALLGDRAVRAASGGVLIYRRVASVQAGGKRVGSGGEPGLSDDE